MLRVPLEILPGNEEPIGFFLQIRPLPNGAILVLSLDWGFQVRRDGIVGAKRRLRWSNVRHSLSSLPKVAETHYRHVVFAARIPCTVGGWSCRGQNFSNYSLPSRRVRTISVVN